MDQQRRRHAVSPPLPQLALRGVERVVRAHEYERHARAGQRYVGLRLLEVPSGRVDRIGERLRRVLAQARPERLPNTLVRAAVQLRRREVGRADREPVVGAQALPGGIGAPVDRAGRGVTPARAVGEMAERVRRGPAAHRGAVPEIDPIAPVVAAPVHIRVLETRIPAHSQLGRARVVRVDVVARASRHRRERIVAIGADIDAVAAVATDLAVGDRRRRRKRT